MNKEKLLNMFKENLVAWEFKEKEKLVQAAREKYSLLENTQIEDWRKDVETISLLVKRNARFATIIDLSGITLSSNAGKESIVYTTSIVVNRNYLNNVFNNVEDFKRYPGGFLGTEKILIIRVIRNRRKAPELFNLDRDTHKYLLVEYKDFFNMKTLNKLVSIKGEGRKIFLIVEGMGLTVLKIIFKSLGIVISSGKNNLKGSLSPTQFNLSRLMLSIFNTSAFKIITQSFYDIDKFVSKPAMDLTERNLELFIKTIIIDENNLFCFMNSSLAKYKKLKSETNLLLMEKDIEKINKYIKENPSKFVEVNKKNTIKPSMFKEQKRSFSTSTCFYESKKTNINYKDKSFKLGSPIFNSLNTIIRDNPINEETQKKIESILFDYSYIWLVNNDKKNISFTGIDYSIINPNLTKILLDSEISLIKLINNFKDDNSLKANSKSDEEILYTKLAAVLTVVSNKDLISIMYGYLLKILSRYERKHDNFNSVVDICYNLGRDLINNYYYKEYLKVKSKIKTENYFLSNWKSDNKIILGKFEDNTILFNIGSVLIGWMLTCKILEKKIVKISQKEKTNIIIPTKSLIDTIKKHNFMVYNIPKKIPMIVKPKVYSKEVLGGYLLNDVVSIDKLLINKRDHKEQTIIKDYNIIYNIVNKVSSVGYKINNDVLDFILGYSKDYLKEEIIDLNYKHPLLEKTKLTKAEKKELDSFLSKKELQENILGLASVFSNIPSFYIPVHLDFRGRLNCVPEFLNYQSNSMSKSLLLFSHPEKIHKFDNKSIDYLKLYGATCFGLDKKSVVERLEWVDSNIKNIIDFKNGVLIEKAKDKFLFIAFCFEYNRWLNCCDNHDVFYFESFLPIQMDATCNGFQHLSLLSMDPSLGVELNLTESNKNDTPKDFYSFIITSFMSYLKIELEENTELSLETRQSYNRLIECKLKRHVIKKSIMTIPYNVSNYQLVNYIKENFSRINNSEWYTTKEDNTIKLHYSDFTILGKGLIYILGYKFNKLKLLLNYLDETAKVCTILQIPIIWTLPTGLQVKQSYLEEKEVRIKPFFYHENRFVLKIIDKSKFNKEKQIRAFMPNLVHSLDAASLALLLDSYLADGLKNVYTVHDCFAVNANNISNLMYLLKLTYIKIYSDETYLKRLDKGIIDNIKNIFGDHSFDDKTRVINIPESNINIEFPDVNVVLGKEPKLDFNSLKKSTYILN